MLASTSGAPSLKPLSAVATVSTLDEGKGALCLSEEGGRRDQVREGVCNSHSTGIQARPSQRHAHIQVVPKSTSKSKCVYISYNIIELYTVLVISSSLHTQ